MRWLAWGIALGLALSGCGESHIPEDAGAGRDAAPVDASFGVDAALPDAGPPAHDSLIVLREEGDEAVLIDADESGVRLELARVPLLPDESASTFVGGPTPDVGLLFTAIPWMDGARRPVHLVSLGGGPSTNVYIAIESHERESPCVDPRFNEVRWSSDGRSVFVTCRQVDAGGVIVGSRVYHVDVAGDVTRLGGDCSAVMVTTHDGRVLIRDADTCDALAPAALFEPRSGSRRELDALADDEIVHYWDPTVRGFVASTATVRGRDFELSNLRWFSDDGTRGELLRASLPFVPILLAPSLDGDALVIAQRVPDSGVIESIVIHGLREPSETPVPLPDGCSDIVGAPHVQWAPDGRRFHLSCREGPRVVDRDGTSVPIAPPSGDRSSLGLDWSADSTRILRHVSEGVAVVHPDTGSVDELPRAVRELSPIRVSWRTRPRRPDCGALTGC